MISEEELQSLKTENAELRRQVTMVSNQIEGLKDIISTVVSVIEQSGEKVNNLADYAIAQDARLKNMRYELADEFGISCFNFPKFRSTEETLRLIVEEGKSLGRFGDGEFDIAFGIPRQKFQKCDERLAERIREVLLTDNDNLLVAIADNYGKLNKYTEHGADGIRIYMSDETRRRHDSLLRKDYLYSDTYITRAYVMYRDSNTDAPLKRFRALQKIWDKKHIIIVEGKQTRLGVGNDLFDNAKSIKRIEAPATSSFDRYDDLLNASLRHAEEADLFILAIGPSSGVLAYDLSMKGYQAVDVGHIDMEYEWFKAGKGTRVEVKGKYNNEVIGGDVVEEVVDDKYLSEIIEDYSV